MNTLNDTVRSPINSVRTAECVPHMGSIRMLRLPAVKQMTGLGKTKIYELQAAGDFPMRVRLSTHCVGWVEQDVQAWLSRRVDESQALSD